MLAKISQTDFATKVVQYHKRCGAKYQKDAESIFHNKSRKTLNDASSTQSKLIMNGIKKGKSTLMSKSMMSSFIEV